MGGRTKPPLLRPNPAVGLSKLGNPTEGWHTWTDDEIRQFEDRHPIGSKARLAFALLLYTGVRRSDVVALGRQHEHHGRLRFRPFKGRRCHPIFIDIPILPILANIIAASPTGHLTYLVTEYGRPFTHGGFTAWFHKRCAQAGLKGCSAHGLRKAGATRAAENGATTHQLMAIFGWLSVQQAERYTRAAERRRMASTGMETLLPQSKCPTQHPAAPTWDKTTKKT
jgi:integrase